MPPADLTTAAGVIAGLVTIVGVLFRLHLQADQDDRDQRDRAMAALEKALDGNKLNAAAAADMAKAWDARNKADARRRAP